MMVYHLFQQLWLDVENSHLVGEKLYNHNLCEILYYLVFSFQNCLTTEEGKEAPLYHFTM